jgi:hypothetical protein
VRTTFLLAALAAVVVLTVMVTVLTAVAIRTAVRRNRVHPDIETGVPLAWSWWPAAPARDHRRLRAAVSHIAIPPTSRRVVPGRRRSGHAAADASGLGRLGLALVNQAAALDHELLVASRLPPSTRRAVLRARHHDVVHIERLARMFRREGAAAVASPLPPCGADRDAVLDAVELRLRHLREAHDELRALEADTAAEARGDLIPAYPEEFRAAG